MTQSAELMKRFAHLTERQREAISARDRSVLVSAAAGSGKTTVLAERCAYLVCDLPAAERCGVGELLVVTFTDAAAGEMRDRIGKAIRQRMDERPRDRWLREQLYLLDSASISTIHAFCKTVVQRWFPQAGIDPQATVLGGDEAELLRRETLEKLFVELYERDDAFGTSFQELVDQYGAGEDGQIGEIVLGVHAFTNSLPDPDKWLEQAAAAMDVDDPGSAAARVDELQAGRLRNELSRQIDYAEHVIDTIRRSWPIAVNRIEAVQALQEQLHGWREAVSRDPSQWEHVAATIRTFEFGRLPSRPRDLSDEDKQAYERAKDLYVKAKKLVQDELTGKLCRFTADEYRQGMRRAAPFVRTFTRLVRELEERYRLAKDVQAAMDFNDLQRGALRVLAEGGDADRPSAIARQLQQQYRYVLVDEFQDVDPLQDAILRLVSREAADPPAGNLFTVGDIKQSIYRFRLAEPTLFADRAARFSAANALGRTIHLQENFRSRAGVLDAVNLVFRALMSETFGGSAYDADAELRAGATYPACPDGVVAFDAPAVEVHLLEPITEATRQSSADSQGDGDDDSDGNDAGESGEELEGIEREAVLIAGRIRRWMGLDGGERWQVVGRPATPGGAPMLRPIEYGDVVILLRAMLHKAGPIAEVLRRMGIPVRIESGDDSLDSTEFRDMYSLLQVLDNQQQDIPLAAVLRSPLLGDALDASDLLRVRLIDRNVPFHAAVRTYAVSGADDALRERVATLLARLAHLRERIQREPVAEVLWDVYEQDGYLAFASGLPAGTQRRGQLLRIHEMARQFGRFARQGLRRFLRYLDQMVERERGGPPATARSGGDDAVRIMTIHASKGLEFPVVVLADLQKKFNLSDSLGVALVDRQMGLALQVSDAERRIRYPTLLHQLAAERAKRESLSEELRVLYVALTRAREHLVLVGRCALKKIEAAQGGGGGALPAVELEGSQSLLDWLVPVLGMLPADAVNWAADEAAHSPSGRAQARPLFDVYTYERAETDAWSIPPARRPETADLLNRVARLNPLPPDEPMADTDETSEVIAALGHIYPGLELTTVSARTSVSDLKRAWQADRDPEERVSHGFAGGVAGGLSKPEFLRDDAGAMDAAERGTATHRFMQLLDLGGACDAADLRRQREAMVATGRMSAGDAGVVDIDAAAWFFDSELGRRVRHSRDRVHREVPFVGRVPPQRVDPMVRSRDHRDVVLVRGMIDLLFAGEREIEILDFKTDRVTGEGVAARAEFYRPQLAYYAEAAAGAWGLPVTRQWLVFLSPRRIVDLNQ